MSKRCVELGLVSGGLLCLILCVQQYGDSRHEGITIEERERQLPELEAGDTLLVTFPLHNASRRTIRIVGLGEC